MSNASLKFVQDFQKIRILIAKECKNAFKMSGEIEVDESYFLFRLFCNCKQNVQKECVVSVYVGLIAKVFASLSFLSLCKK
ncbi:hypothetical protein DMC01_09155 [Campylobacter troglodytis]|nr:hypothetical protein DMC01_09155 [Campylobacter troglodytis]